VHAGCPTRYWEFLREEAEYAAESANNPPVETGKFRTDERSEFAPTIVRPLAPTSKPLRTDKRKKDRTD